SLGGHPDLPLRGYKGRPRPRFVRRQRELQTGLTRWPASIGMGGRLPSESVPDCLGISGRFPSDYAGAGAAGWVESGNVALEVRWAEGRNGRVGAVDLDVARRPALP